MTKNFGDPPCPLGGRISMFFLRFFLPCAWEPHAHVRMGLSCAQHNYYWMNKVKNTQLPSPLRPQTKKSRGWADKSRVLGKPTRGCRRSVKHWIWLLREWGRCLKTTLQTWVPENFRSRRWGAERRVSRAQTRERGPPSAWAEILFKNKAKYG